MKLAISHIAWPVSESKSYYELLARAGFKGLEVAPSLFWEEPIEPRKQDVAAIREEVETVHGLQIVGFQALFYKQPGMNLFSDDDTQLDQMIRYTVRLARVCGELGGKVLVHGSPGSRKLPSGANFSFSWDRAIHYFRTVAEAIEPYGVTYLIEPLAQQERCDFIHNMDEAYDLFRAVDRPAFGLHLDTKTAFLNGEDITKCFEKGGSAIKHMHLSVPALGSLTEYPQIVREGLQAAKEAGYDHWCSIEMRQKSANNREHVEANLDLVKKLVD